MQKHLALTRQRIQIPLRDDQLWSRLYPEKSPVKLTVFKAPGRIAYAEATRGRYRPARVGQRFGPLWATYWFRVEVAIPRSWRGREVHFLWDAVSEGCVWENGVPLQGLTGSGTAPWMGASRPIRHQYVLTRHARGGERRTFHVELACNQLFGADARPAQLGTLLQAEVAVFDRDAWALLWDYATVAELAEHLPADSPRGNQALYAANAMINALELDDPATWPRARAIARQYLAARNGDGQHNVSAIGHAHIDTAWLWPLGETKRKCYRTFSSAVRYMDEYPEYKFACSQAQQYEWMQQEQPALWAKIKQKVRAGQFVPVGGTWVEPDCNIPNGESLVRQFLFGQRFFARAFGRRCREFWNPDVFGYNGQLPQLMRGAGIGRFLTQKLSWNQFNKPHSHTFWWEGIDGSRVLTHFPPADTYNGVCTPRELLFNVRNYKDLERSNESYYLFGYGDGGGGPTLEMLERLRRSRDVDGLPRVAQRSATEFFDRLEQDMKVLTVQVGELYFELHRGTYTAQARNKRSNRRAEELLHDVEFLAAVAGADNRRARYPRAELDRLWKLVLLNQFHDIIPGSSITEVYAESGEQYADVLASGAKLRDAALAVLLSLEGERPREPRTVLRGSAGASPSRADDRLIAINTLGFERTEVVDVAGRPAVVRAPSMGWAVQSAADAAGVPPVTIAESASAITLENQFLRATLRRDGRLTSLFDKRTGRETMAGAGNQFVMYDDNPANFDAWDVDAFHLEKRRDVAGVRGCRIVARHPLRVAVEFTYELEGERPREPLPVTARREPRPPARSTLRQRVSLDAVAPRLEFACEADWHASHQFLKVEFPTTIRADHATYEIQFGHLQRSTRFNNSFDIARFEVCAQRWADLSEPGLGLALLNDCKYGHAVHGNVMRLSLLRSSKSPDPVADQGRHEFRYALLPHAGDYRAAGVIQAAQAFNVPLLVRSVAGGGPNPTSPAMPLSSRARRGICDICQAPAITTKIPRKLGMTTAQARSFFAVDNPAVVIDTVKRAEDSDALVVRLYEAHGSRARVRLTSPLAVRSARQCNLLEDEQRPLAWSRGGVRLTLRPFEIVTLKLTIR